MIYLKLRGGLSDAQPVGSAGVVVADESKPMREVEGPPYRLKP